MYKDISQRFIFDQASIRGEIIRVDETFKTIMDQRDYPPVVKSLLGEAIVSCILLAGSIKFAGNISLQFQGDERLPLLLVQCDHNLQVRACAKFSEDSQVEYDKAFLEGSMVLTINQHKQPQAYQSVVPIHSTSMAENLMKYLAQSEQIPSKVWLAVGDDLAAGMLLQLMPDEDTQQREEFWEYAVKIGETITQDELLNLDNETILYRLYHEERVRLFDPRGIRFQCKCSKERMIQTLKSLGEDDVQQLVQERGNVEMHCDFCNQQYLFDPIDITLLFRQ